jgi:hypothetical protein
MRILRLRHGTILIASAAGEFRNISVSGLAKIRVLWLFRKSCIVGFPGLNKKQQRLIARVWHGARAEPAEAFREPIGTVEAFSPEAFTPQLDQPATPIAEPVRASAGIGRAGGLPTPALWAAAGILLVGFALTLAPKHRVMDAQRSMAQSGAAVVAAVNSVSSAVTAPAQTLAEPSVSSTAAAQEADKSDTPSVAALRAPAREASSSPAAHSANAHPGNASLLKVGLLRIKALQREVDTEVAGRPTALKKPEVIVRVRVDRVGRAQAFQIVRGKQDISAALAAVKRWPFQPCAGGTDCKHLLRFTNYGDASVIQVID